MAQAKGKQGKKKEQKPDLPVPFFDALTKPDSENNRPDIYKQEDQKHIQILPIPEQVVVVKESKWSLRLQLALVLCSIGMLLTVYFLSSDQNKITNDTLNFQIRKTFSDSIAQHVKDSLTSTKTDSSLALTRRSVGLTEQSINIAKSTLDINKRGFIPNIDFDDIEINSFTVGKAASITYRIANKGNSVALSINPFWKYGIVKNSGILKVDPIKIDTIKGGFFLAAGKTMDFTVWLPTYMYSDSIVLAGKDSSLHLVCKIIYMDQLGNWHWVQDGWVCIAKTSELRGLKKYAGTDYDENKYARKQAQDDY